MGRKYMTTIVNLDDYGFILDDFCNVLSKKFASSCTVGNLPDSKISLIQLQGKCANEVKKLLMQDYKFPQKYIIIK